jgi:hypothetical protein
MRTSYALVIELVYITDEVTGMGLHSSWVLA